MDIKSHNLNLLKLFIFASDSVLLTSFAKYNECTHNTYHNGNNIHLIKADIQRQVGLQSCFVYRSIYIHTYVYSPLMTWLSLYVYLFRLMYDGRRNFSEQQRTRKHISHVNINDVGSTVWHSDTERISSSHGENRAERVRIKESLWSQVKSCDKSRPVKGLELTCKASAMPGHAIDTAHDTNSFNVKWKAQLSL